MIKIEGTVEFKEPQLETTVNGFKALKLQIKEAKNELAGLEEGTEDYTKKAAEIGALTNQVDDLNKSISAVSGAPMENLNGSFGLFSNQLENLDLDGASTSFKSLWATIVANPFTAIVAVLGLVINNWEKIIKLIDIFRSKQKSLVDEAEAVYKAQKINSDARIRQIDREIELAKAYGVEQSKINDLMSSV
jgi:hypothetical protein